ncbi:TIGR00730 family Rossman fold protein [uncultured Lacticaseibacillus sp.]|uniref:LOG family protein n=1 Tax=uncultured Lacticaseibacillus sp. TaxID=2775882 RepID=UPI00338F80E5
MVVKLSVFCGSRYGAKKSYEQVAHAFGWYLGSRHVELVYGGSVSGIMGTISGATLAAGGEVTGIYPEGLFDAELPRVNTTHAIRTSTIDERKKLLIEEPDAFFVFPGGFGTLEEISQAISWMTIGLIEVKPIGIFNMGGFYDPLVEQLQIFVDQGFATDIMPHIHVSDNFEDLVQMLDADRAALDATAAAK